ncbi:similar to ubiquitin-protein ligase molybdopterin-converting factor [Plenodomus lingam JN3]|uniref:Similar to ubiquitin-protein ligase molybdopterin-converting factor n=1 Tax=Leptosphaeria maculans (strain JN3 / isolate v23.1.3 / race Av1-4-5-6-7-8) TaxID=985895 RepID=E5A1K9_LEPMJ|nr:similar to ubiquitin-protein ligase molybdopterin-converting factor [Plenodomus lingam JN3]CBX97473.1 similar to ubiquitin-protein ligase molybdopterin-converting factor [Plenodomus lingam JN3]
MSSWVSRATESRNAQLITTAAVSGVVVASTILGFQKARRMTRVADLKASIPDVSPDHHASRMTEYGAASTVFAPNLILEQLARNRVFLTDPGIAKLRSAFVIVVGCGGVGSHATAALARSGCSKLRLIDFDQVTLSSLNRHAVATLADVGTPKVHCLRKRLEQVTPWTHFECRNELFSEQTAAAQLAPMNEQPPDFVIDAIDNIDSKVALLAYCYKNNIKVISSMGAGCKSDPTRIFIGDISTSTDDPLSKSTRRKLRLQGVKDGIPVVYSTERPGPGKAELQPLSEEEVARGSVGELGVLADFRVRILPVLGTMPAIFGLAVANHVILSIADYPHEYLPSKSRDKMYDGILGALQGAEERLARALFIEEAQGLKVPITQDDVGYLVEEVYSGRSIISGLSTRLTLVRWKKPTANFVDERTPGQKCSMLTMKDLVLMTKEEATKHEKAVLKGEKRLDEVYDAETIARVEKRLQEEERYERLR